MDVQNNPVDYLSLKISTSLKNLENGLDPDVLAYWYKKIEERSIDLVPNDLKNNIHFIQDRFLWMKFDLNISKHSIPYILKSIEDFIEVMPYSTALYFANVSQILVQKTES